jgi:hypothetical protein
MIPGNTGFMGISPQQIVVSGVGMNPCGKIHAQDFFEEEVIRLQFLSG